ncbi:conjugal transfer protein TraD [Pseudogemmobacter sonorensis]|uniref:conjugal transfer protein TraD n=1 Tax=Pseudogemmobacter sonorensis TaxID=2989681 RepID=UPI0036A0DF53
MRTWQVERRKRTRHLIELGGLVVKAGIVDLTGDDRAMIYGAMIWIADKLKSEDGERAQGVWRKLGKMAFEADGPESIPCSRVEHGAMFRKRRTDSI